MVMFDGYAERVEKHQKDDKPVEPLLLDGASDKKSDALLAPPKLFASTVVP